jgi:hypothetical protein
LEVRETAFSHEIGLQKVKIQDNEHSMKENEKRGYFSRERGSKGEKEDGRMDLLIGMTVPIL